MHSKFCNIHSRSLITRTTAHTHKRSSGSAHKQIRLKHTSGSGYSTTSPTNISSSWARSISAPLRTKRLRLCAPSESPALFFCSAQTACTRVLMRLDGMPPCPAHSEYKVDVNRTPPSLRRWQLENTQQAASSPKALPEHQVCDRKSSLIMCHHIHVTEQNILMAGCMKAHADDAENSTRRILDPATAIRRYSYGRHRLVVPLQTWLAAWSFFSVHGTHTEH